MRLALEIGLVAFGSACGGLLRWVTGTAVARMFGTALPYGTLVINLSGSLFLGWFLTMLADRVPLGSRTWLQSDDLRMLVAIGFTGSFTTFSTFEWEAYSLMRDGQTWIATGYTVASVVLGLLALRLGVLLARAG